MNNNSQDTRNMIYFLIASMVLLFGYQYFVTGPQQKKAQEQRAVAAAQASASSSSAVAAGLPVTGAAAVMTREQAIAAAPRVKIDTPSLRGSLSLKGALVDDLYLKSYKETTKAGSPDVELLRPAGSDRAYYVQSGYIGQNIPGLPDANTMWNLQSGNVLSPGKPVVLTHDNGAGLMFTRTLSIDDNYMITVAEAVANTGAGPVAFSPYSTVIRFDMPAGLDRTGVVHEGAIATFPNKIEAGKIDRYKTQSLKYKDMAKEPEKKVFKDVASVGGWFGLTDKYWMAAVIPAQDQPVRFTTQANVQNNKPIYRAGYLDETVTVAPGQTWQSQSHIFAGAKLNSQLQAYENDLKIPRFGYATDWGSLQFLTYPMYWLLDKLYGFLGNFGFAILALTVIVKIVFYPLAHKAYESMTKMKQVQDRLKPKLDAIKSRFPDDPQKQQEATMKLYQDEKVNPMAGLGGCLPMLLQIPVFWALYKVLILAIEMRHAPFFGWIKDLSAPDPTSFVNLFGLLPFEPATVPLIGGILAGPLHLGVVAILYGLSMWLSQQMTPTANVDPMQKKMLAFMPVILTFFMAQVAVGLIIYWIWSNILTIFQQWTIMHRLKVENPIDTGIGKVRALLDRKKAA
ncbi:membrane protein insertase, YidC/Oxa1 family, N-terminal domain-containing protein [Asticcacaulis biprosthecium C19]|uniref:Membrane protein insertase YidC n=1 Tax=Asticcacaulis biprosthecium C19 TaxID=715226 RepID=F4QIZ8_9CAUL|nr:membrane protein insertase YidC [Asticcacaulis biprosthecium]EGF93061.1 membrane protein insertase, YidC/Oxa1 family, N-terminal domain-containing protein [Asticcacaulis biprosthecium C19]